ncbi:YHS domain-containing (seleno)protein [Aliiglaciecola sp. 2_MG-2023]|uniref:YHS domain-containing (seleno)protein n=1 Tax=unclassified Aliiglaciecola TaxID=2593648 RepID=UPI0026E3FD52|nr:MULTISPECIES: YHS domain-containing (seleno)protein [unclassified Aliiglaciecola]MDO6710621.1 YHS domain-containing (seleno)protein [Aliiglaciecola sp. 2_MG-2023]MDO6754292.1 YHS domain-containing (seleno)protein [Aliiglaciecola sp. 1_MG-2023]
MNALKVLIFALTSLFFTAAHASDPIETGFFNNHAIYGYDTVAYFTENKPVKGNKQISYDWRGAQWHFSSEEHKAMFAANPEKYAPQYGGYCAYAMADGNLVGIDEEAFTIVNNKLYLNYSIGVMEKWLENRDEYIRKADEQYPLVVNF